MFRYYPVLTNEQSEAKRNAASAQMTIDRVNRLARERERRQQQKQLLEQQQLNERFQQRHH